MLMSLFSPVEALCAESIGQKLGFSYSTTGNSSNLKKLDNHARPLPESGRITPAPASMDGFNKDAKDGANQTSNSSNRKRPQQLQRRPRFAPEFDGVFCFETILPF